MTHDPVKTFPVGSAEFRLVRRPGWRWISVDGQADEEASEAGLVKQMRERERSCGRWMTGAGRLRYVSLYNKVVLWLRRGLGIGPCKVRLLWSSFARMPFLTWHSASVARVWRYRNLIITIITITDATMQWLMRVTAGLDIQSSHTTTRPRVNYSMCTCEYNLYVTYMLSVALHCRYMLHYS